MKTADDLHAEGKRLHECGNMVVFLYPSQEWMAVQAQTPFLRHETIPADSSRSPTEEKA